MKYKKYNVTEQGLNLYYLEPEDKIFEEVKAKAIKLWKDITQDNSYRKEKLSRIESLQNVRDNFMFMLAMFDPVNQFRLKAELSEQAINEINKRLLAGGANKIL